MALKWGIVSVGNISNDFTRSLRMFSKSECDVVAVAARDLQRAQEFARTYDITRAYGDYQSLAQDKNVDIVYVGTIHPYHFEVAKLMLENGKHVLCEKPMTMNERQTRELITISRERKLFLMEAIWSRCFPAYEELRKLIDSGLIGDVKYVEIAFGRPLSHKERMYEKKLGGGTILDLGVYTLQFQQFIFKGEEPLKIVASGCLNQHGTDECASAIITYEGGKTAVVTSHAVVELPNTALVVGTKGEIRMPTFWCPSKLITPEGTLDFELPPSEFTSTRPGGFTYEILEVARCIKKGLVESPKMTHKESIQLAKLMDKWRQEVGVVYDSDL